MTESTKAGRRRAARKAAATRKADEARQSGEDMKKAFGNATAAAKQLGTTAASTISHAGKAASRRARI